MQYADNQMVQIGDEVTINADERGIVIGLIETAEYLEGLVSQEWSYLGNGAIVKSDKFGLLHYTSFEEEVQFKNRAK